MSTGTSTARSSLPPRAVIVTRPTEYEALLERHGTQAMARFFLQSRGRTIEEVEGMHRLVREAVDTVLGAVPLTYRRALVGRSDLDRFLFQPEDIVVTVGQDGLVANVAKYLTGQIVIGINPAARLFDGVLAKHAARSTRSLLELAASPRGESRVEERTMVAAETADGLSLVALNELFVGHRTHQSARYTLRVGEARERQSSSGLVVATGTGATGWARSIFQSRHPDSDKTDLPTPTDRALAFFVREAFPSVATGTSLVEGRFGGAEKLEIASEMNDGGVCFGDGIEEDFLPLPFGQRVEVRIADQRLRLLAA
jgi:NAD kinase